jgi:hypothetical protein
VSAPPAAAARPRARGAAASYLFLALAAAFWSGNFVVGRAVHGRVPPVGLAFWRWAVALALLLPLARRPLAALAPLHLQSVMVIQPVDVLPDGRASMCDGCPDMTVHQGELVWSCRLEERLEYGQFMRAVPAKREKAEA